MTNVVTAAAPAAPLPCVVAFAPRERARALLRTALPRRRARVITTRSAEEFAAALKGALVDAAIVDIGGAQDGTWRAAALARDFPAIAFFGLSPLRAVEGPALAECAGLEFVDVLVEGVDDAAARELILPHGFTARFVDALREPPPMLGLDAPLQRHAWEVIVSYGGRPVRTAALAGALKVTREHLSRTFAADGAPNLKRVIDLVRLIAAAELAKSPGYDIRDIASILEFASSSHLSSTAQRVVGTKATSLSRLRAIDLIERFVRGHGRSRG